MTGMAIIDTQTQIDRLILLIAERERSMEDIARSINGHLRGLHERLYYLEERILGQGESSKPIRERIEELSERKQKP